MEIIYRAKDFADAHILAGYLRARGLECHVGGHYLQGGLGELGATDLTVVRVAAQDVARARELVESYEQSQREPATPAMTGSPLPSPLLVVALFLVSVLVLVNWFG
ncbi:MAG: DUF2007 domain-containing protein [Pseudomonadota bacterium]|nr:DUF2007 domain-containing protein [Pseudomonadota bacterium]